MLKKGVFWLLVLLLGMVQYRLWFSKNGLLEMLNLKRTLLEQQVKNDNLAAENGRLRRDIELLKREDERMVENRARDELGMIKEGEVYYHVVK